MKSLFSQLDPAVKKAQGDATGEFGFALKYKADRQLLMVRIIAAQGLASRQVARLNVNPQVGVRLKEGKFGNFYIEYL